MLSLWRESIQRAAEDLPYGPRTPQMPRCSALPAADEAEHKRVQRSVCNEAVLAARRTQGTANDPKRKADRFFIIQLLLRFPLWNSLWQVGTDEKA